MIKKALVAVVLATSLTACSTNLKIKNQVEIVGGDMGDIKIVDLKSMRVNGFLIAQGWFFNQGSKTVQGYYRCKFLDATNFQVGDDQTWQLITVYPNQKEGLKCTSMSTTATDFKIEFSNNLTNVTQYD